MGLKIMLTVDLNNATSDQRQKFNEALQNKNYTKIKELTTIWRASFGDSVSEADAIAAVKNHVAAAAKAAGISDYDAGVMVGNNFPTVF